MYIKILFFGLCFFTISLFSMEIVPAKPTLIGTIYIDHDYTSAAYASKKYHEDLTKKGITSSIENTLIPVTIRGGAILAALDRRIGLHSGGAKVEDVDWTTTVPYQIKDFERREYEANGTELSLRALLEINKKKFPRLIPALYFFNAKTETILSFTLFDYPVELTCCDNPNTGQLFEKDYERCINTFKNTPTYVTLNSDLVDPIEELVAHGLLEKTERGLRHGRKSFVSLELVEKLMEMNRSVMFVLWPFFRIVE